jgi:hypothetical protein
MARRIFISCHYADRQRAKGFNLLQWNKNVDLDFVGRHLLDPVDSKNRDHITQKIKEQLHGTSATVVLIGKQTADREWIEREIQWSLEKGNGILGIKLEPDVEIPQALTDCGAEIIEWNVHEFSDAIERACEGTRRTEEIRKTTGTGGDSCAR